MAITDTGGAPERIERRDGRVAAVDRTRPDPARTALLSFLAAQRASVLAIVDGLDDAALRQAPVPTGWTPMGLIEHLARAERFFQEVVSGEVSRLA